MPCELLLALWLALNFSSLAFAEIVGKTISSQSNSTQSSCELMDLPPEISLMPLSWDRQQINEDLMVEEMRKGKYNPKNVKVAVFDVAFDMRARAKINGQIVLDGPPTKPKIEHATSVIARITRGAPGSIVKNYPVMESANPSADDLLKMATRACTEGFQVINLSVYSRGGAILINQPMVRAALAARGCVLVQASGNGQGSAEARKESRNDIKAATFRDADILTVGASDIKGGRGTFSTLAIVRAPGVEVPILDPTHQKLTDDGTSYAAPSVSAIVKNILTILHTAKPKLSPMDEVPLATAIVKESAVRDIADGYRAVILAKAVAKKGARAMLGNAKTRESFAQAAYSEEAARVKPPGQCEHLQACVKRTCYQDKRKLIALTGQASIDDVKDLLATTRASEDPGLAEQWSNALNKMLSSGASPSR